MGQLARVVSFSRATRNGVSVSDLKVDTGGGYLVLAEHYAPAGEDAYPIPGDYVMLEEVLQSGRVVALGYLDPKSPQQAGLGDRIVYARDASGVGVVKVWLKSDGSARIDNSAGYLELRTDGTVEVNGATILTNGDVLTSDGVSLRNHTHPQVPDSAGNTQQNTGPPLI